MNLKDKNTLGLSSESPLFFAIHHESDLRELIHQVQDRKLVLPFYFLGDGSNLILSKIISNPVVQMKILGRKILSEDSESVIVQASAGENWNEFVHWTVEKNFYGLENLVLIPGTVGASPIQNIGAYGVEAKDFIHSVKGYDFEKKEWFSLTNEQCQFAYRDSLFKQSGHQSKLITEVVFKLSKKADKVNLTYKELKNHLEIHSRSATAENVLLSVKELRMNKLPDPSVIGNAGSFFKNPLLQPEKAQQLKSQFPLLPMYPQTDGTLKVSAGWMIEKCGWKGQRLGPVGMYEKQALVLVKHDEATADDVLKLAEAVKADVLRQFGVDLEIEPLIWK